MTINRPEARNAVSPEVHRAMIAAWADFAEDASVERLGRFYEKRDAGRAGAARNGIVRRLRHR